MNAYTTQILIRAMACQARIEAMKAANAWRENRGEAQAYNEEQFQVEAADLERLANDLHEGRMKGFAE